MNKLINTTTRFLKSRSPMLLTGVGVAGVVATAYLSAKATVKTMRDLEGETNPPQNKKEYVSYYWRNYVPAAAMGTLTIGCIIGSNNISSRRAAAAVVAYSLADQAFSEYKEKVVEQIGFRKEEKIRDEVAQDRVNRNQPPSDILMQAGPGRVLCCELYTGRYFVSDMEKLRKAQNDLNAKLLRHDTATLDDFYHLVGLKGTSISGELGWMTPKLLELNFNTALTEDGTPCITFSYNYTSLIHDGGRFHGVCLAD